jgi:hypothetical protein
VGGLTLEEGLVGHIPFVEGLLVELVHQRVILELEADNT